jgi:serine protease Do
MEREVTAIVEAVRPWLVQVTASFGDGEGREALRFSGVVYSKDGYIVTDASGVEAATEIRVKSGESILAARHVASDRRSGVAVLKVQAADLRPVLFADAACRPGAWVVAVGNAFGMKSSVSVGTVGGVGRSILVAGRKYEDMIQVSAAVHPGDCGGIVADSSGKFVGLIHSVYHADAGEKDGALGLLQLLGKDIPSLQPAGPSPIGFAVPAEGVRFAADRIIRHRRMVRGWLGVTARPPDPATRAHLGIPEGGGAEIVRVEPDSPARRARLRSGDILAEFAGEPVRDVDAIRRKIAAYEEPAKVRAAVLRHGERRDVEIQIEIDPQR